MDDCVVDVHMNDSRLSALWIDILSGLPCAGHEGLLLQCLSLKITRVLFRVTFCSPWFVCVYIISHMRALALAFRICNE